MGTALGALTALCGSGGVMPGGSLLLGLFIAGAAGSTLHCVPMCSGFVLGQVADRMAAVPAARLCEWRRLGAGMLLPYHLGRLTTYAALGAVAAGSGAALARLPWFGRLSGVLLLLASSLFLLHALRRAVPALARHLPALDRAPRGWHRIIARLTRGQPRNHPAGGYLLGVTLAFLPCGLLYAALLAVSASLDPLAGAGGMLAFGLGTAPALVLVGIAGHAAGQRWQRAVIAAAPALMLLNAALLAALALHRISAAT